MLEDIALFNVIIAPLFSPEFKPYSVRFRISDRIIAYIYNIYMALYKYRMIAYVPFHKDFNISFHSLTKKEAST